MLKKLLTFMTLVVWHSCVLANSPADDLTLRLSTLNVMRADFSQTIMDKNAKKIQQSVGQMAMQRPGKFRWDVKKPVAQLVITNGAKVWIYDPDLEQVTIRYLTKEVGESPAMLLTHSNTAIEKDYKVVSDKALSGGLEWFTLTPKNQNSLFAKVRLGFLKNEIHEMELQDHLGHTTQIAFYNIKMNPTLSSSLFSFKPPVNIDVIDETKH
jgi:outer membrane lipoprotein carrier protein